MRHYYYNERHTLGCNNLHAHVYALRLHSKSNDVHERGACPLPPIGPNPAPMNASPPSLPLPNPHTSRHCVLL